jgi:proteasome lid subunit RPN8/RPN11
LLQMHRQHASEMVSYAQEDLPNECCGILAGRDGQVLNVYRMSNVESSPYRFSMKPTEVAQVDQDASDRGWELLAIYHSHTHTSAYPSDTDVRIAGGTSELWPEVRYVILSLMDSDSPQIRLFEIKDALVTEEPLDIVST